MYALLATTRQFTREGHESRKLLTVEIIGMGCFNGLNQANAFRSGIAGGQIDLSIEIEPTGLPVINTNHAVKAWGGNSAERRRLATEFNGWVAGLVETIGLGYASHAVVNTQKTLAELMATGRTDVNKKADPYVGHLLYQEGFLSPFRSPVTGSGTQSLRVLTPNEQILNTCFGAFEGGSRAFDQTFRDTLSKLAVTVTANRAWRGSLYQFVGSERPSGQAVAYLQAWRNACEYSNQYGFGDHQGQHNLCVTMANSSVWRTKSVIAILSHMFNSGDDSDIITFAGNHYLSYCTKVGFWNTTSLFRNTSSMLTEGRYNKGGQSTSIRDKLYRQRSMSSRSATHSLWSVDLGKQLDLIKVSFDAASNLAYSVNLRDLTHFGDTSRVSDTQREQKIEQINSYIRQLWASDPAGQLNTFLAEAVQLPDLSIPVVQTTTPAEQPAGFVQWVAEATQTVH